MQSGLLPIVDEAGLYFHNLMIECQSYVRVKKFSREFFSRDFFQIKSPSI